MMTAEEARNEMYKQIEKLASDDISFAEAALDKAISDGYNFFDIPYNKLNDPDMLKKYLEEHLGYKVSKSTANTCLLIRF